MGSWDALPVFPLMQWVSTSRLATINAFGNYIRVYHYTSLTLVFLSYRSREKVMFEIELVTFIDYKAASDYSQLTHEDRRQMTVQDLIAVANAERAVSPPGLLL